MEEQGKQEKAAQYYNEAILVARKIAEKMEGDPTSEQDKKTEWQIKIKDSLNKLGVVDKAQGKLDKAQQCFLESESIMEKLVKNRPENSEWQLELFRIKIFLADMLETSSKQ
jgi:tetratricopeptide (TPR) repeat protein